MAGDAMSATAAPVADEQALHDFAGKWRARWPEWSVAEVFVPRSQRATAVAWAALQQELTDAAWAAGDALPGWNAKVGRGGVGR
ncbi:hypothetical protein ACLMLE_27050, partial [Lysobacter capsici]